MRDILAVPAFRRLWLVHGLSLIGTVLLDVGLMVLVYQRSGSALQAIGVTLATVLPQALLGPVAGAVVDHLPRPAVLRAVDALRAALCAVAYAVVVAGAPLWAVYAVVVLLSCAQTLHEPARMALVPKLAPEGRLVAANGLITSTTQAAYASSHFLGALLVLRAGIAGSAGLAGAAFAASAVLAWRLREPAGGDDADARDDDGVVGAVARSEPGLRPPSGSILARAAGAVTGTWQRAGDGFGMIRREPLARALVAMECLEWIPHGIWTPALMLAYTTRDLGASPAWWGAQESSFGAGMLLGALLATALSARLGANAGRVIVGNAVLFGVLTLAYAASPDVVAATVLCFAFGPTGAMRDVAQDALLQQAVPDRYLGRVYALRTMGAAVAYAVAAPAFALAADHAPVRWVYAAGGLLYLAAAAYAGSRVVVRRARVVGVRKKEEC